MCACTHYLVFKEPTPARPWRTADARSVHAALTRGALLLNLARLLKPLRPVNLERPELCRQGKRKSASVKDLPALTPRRIRWFSRLFRPCRRQIFHRNLCEV